MYSCIYVHMYMYVCTYIIVHMAKNRPLHNITRIYISKYRNVDDFYVLLGLILSIRPDVLDLVDHVQPLRCAPEYGVFTVQPWL
jgi:hypothetical protein